MPNKIPSIETESTIPHTDYPKRAVRWPKPGDDTPIYDTLYTEIVMVEKPAAKKEKAGRESNPRK